MSNLQPTLHGLLYLAALIAVVPVFPFLSLWVRVFLGVCLLVGLLRSRFRSGRTVGRLAVLITVIAVYFSAAQLSLQNVALPLVQVLCLLLAARLASEKNPRNMLQTFVLALVLLAASSLLTLDMLYLVYLVLLTAILSSALILLSFIQEDPHIHLPQTVLKPLGSLLLAVPAITLIIMMALFFILPRTPTPLWNVAGQQSAASAGMTDQVQPGSFADLASTGTIAFRAEIEELPAHMLYWRGIVFDRLDDQVWRRSNHQVQERVRPGGSDARDYVIYAEPKNDLNLVTLDRTVRLQGVSHRTENDGVFIRQRQDYRRSTYRGFAHPGAVAMLEGNVEGYLAVPASISPQLQDIASQLGGAGRDFDALVQQLEGFFLDQQLIYSSENLPVTETPLATFLFESRRGYCEHFASAFAVMLRLMDVPARLVGGYLGGTYNQFGKFYLVTEDRAHVWVEALNDDGVWVRFDPSRLAMNAEQAFSASVAPRTYFESLADALFHSWTRRVLNYDLQQQFELFREASDKLSKLRRFDLSVLPVVLISLSITGVILTVYLLLRRRSRAGLVNVYLRRVAECAGLEKVPAELGLYQLADLSGHPLCREFAERYGAAFYSGVPLDTKEYRRLEHIVRELKGKHLVIDVALPEGLGDNRQSTSLNVIDQKGNPYAVRRSQYHQRCHQRAKSPTG